ncbi:hypothetical protein [Microbacterium sp. NPDC055599]
MANVRKAHFWLQYQILAMTLGLTRAQWETIKVEFGRVWSTGDSVADFMFAARLAGVEVDAPADWGKEPWDAHAAQAKESEKR